VDVMPAEERRVLEDAFLVRRLVDTEGHDLAGRAGNNVADFPDDVGRLLGDDTVRIHADLVHLVIVERAEVPLDEESWHGGLRAADISQWRSAVRRSVTAASAAQSLNGRRTQRSARQLTRRSVRHPRRASSGMSAVPDCLGRVLSGPL